jgi:hypothetical protein
MGGRVPLGYDLKARELVITAADAQFVRSASKTATKFEFSLLQQAGEFEPSRSLAALIHVPIESVTEGRSASRNCPQKGRRRPND